jgi:hypothetical protein
MAYGLGQAFTRKHFCHTVMQEHPGSPCNLAPFVHHVRYCQAPVFSWCCVLSGCRVIPLVAELFIWLLSSSDCRVIPLVAEFLWLPSYSFGCRVPLVAEWFFGYQVSLDAESFPLVAECCRMVRSSYWVIPLDAKFVQMSSANILGGLHSPSSLCLVPVWADFACI